MRVTFIIKGKCAHIKYGTIKNAVVMGFLIHDTYNMIHIMTSYFI